MIRLLPLLVCACNQVYDLEGTRNQDASQPRVYTCPRSGPPVFLPDLHEIVTGNGLCYDYTISSATNLATAYCMSGVDMFGIAEGLTDGPLAFTIPETSKFVHYSAPRLSADGQRLYVLVDTTQFRHYVRYVRSGSTWTEEMMFPSFSDGTLSTIARGPSGDRVLYLELNGDLQEYVEKSGGFTPIGAPIKAADVGLLGFGPPSLSSDGLRVAIPGDLGSERRMFYMDRPNVDVPFGAAVRLPGVPAGFTMSFMTEDCERVYVAGLDRIFYVVQQ